MPGIPNSLLIARLYVDKSSPSFATRGDIFTLALCDLQLPDANHRRSFSYDIRCQECASSPTIAVSSVSWAVPHFPRAIVMKLYTPSNLLIKTYFISLSALESGPRCLSPLLIMRAIAYVHWEQSILCTLKLVLQLLRSLIKPLFRCLPSLSTMDWRRVPRNSSTITGEWLPLSPYFMIYKSA